MSPVPPDACGWPDWAESSSLIRIEGQHRAFGNDRDDHRDERTARMILDAGNMLRLLAEEERDWFSVLLKPIFLSSQEMSSSAIQETPVPKPHESSMTESEVISNSSSIGWGAAEGDDFDYIPVTPWAPVALGLGLIGLTGFIGPFGLYVAFFGIFVGIIAVSKVRAGAGTVKGGRMAWAGLVLSAVSLSLGSAKMYHNYQTEVPEGFARVNFPKDIAEKQFVFIGPKRKLHPDVASLIGTKVYLKGYMWATQNTEGLTSFILLKDNGECCFGGRPRSHDYIWVKLPTFRNGQRPELSRRAGSMTVLQLTAEEKNRLGVDDEEQLATCAFIGKVAVAGVLRADVTAGENGPGEDFEFAPVYSMDAELVEEAWTPF